MDAHYSPSETKFAKHRVHINWLKKLDHLIFLNRVIGFSSDGMLWFTIGN